MRHLVVVNDPRDWPLRVPGIDVVSARDYLTNPEYGAGATTRVYNLCRSQRYQSNGYYVSLLAAARRHRPTPSIATIQDLKTAAVVRTLTEELEQLIQRSLRPILSDEFWLSAYFGRNMAKRHDRLARSLYNLFPAPLMRARFVRDDEEWRLVSVRLIGMADVPRSHHEFLLAAMRSHFRARQRRAARTRTQRYDLAILHAPERPDSPQPSDPAALRRFERAGERLGFSVDLITRDDYGRVAEYDALLIRETTYVNHHTYRFAARAAAEKIAVIDDPESIIRCTNKVYLAELLAAHRISTPRTLIVHRGNVERIEAELGLPCVLKQPDSSFSLGVIKIQDAAALTRETSRMFEDSDLIVAQEFLPTDFDWRVCVLEGQPLFACRYHMAHRHWQIVKRAGGRDRFGRVETIAIEDAPTKVVRTAVRAARLIGDGLYGVDLKQLGRRVYVMEVNDNPNIDAGYEDRVLGNALYEAVIRALLHRVERRHVS